MRVPFRLVDVFAERPLAGNQLCVVPEPVDLPTEAMQSLALEIGFSETTFVTQAGGDRYAMRIFTPAFELPFAGHPTLGTAFVLVSEKRVTNPCIQSVAAGEISLEVDVRGAFARMRQLPPEFGPEVEDLARVARAVGLPEDDLHRELRPQVVSTGLPHLIVPAQSPDSVARARPDSESLLPLLDSYGAGGLYLFSATGDEAKARMFAAGVGVDEDPATGSAAGPLGAFLAERGVISSGRLTISQGVELGRPSSLLVDVEADGQGWTIHVGGGVYVVGEGAFDVAL